MGNQKKMNEENISYNTFSGQVKKWKPEGSQKIWRMRNSQGFQNNSNLI